MRAERIESSLHSRSWSLNRRPDSVSRQAVLLTYGAGEAETEDTRLQVSAPAILWLGDTRPGRLRVDAGATGYRCWASDTMVIAAVGDQAESAALRHLADRSFALSLSDAEDQAAMLGRCCESALAEQREPLKGSPLFQSALLRIMLVVMMRLAGGEEITVPGTGGKSTLLRRFRQLVEMNFRNHWTVARYATALGISTDRLHAICASGVGKPPKALISERLAHEAALRLERSSLTVQQLGHSLGFNDPAHFSTFFRRMTGMAPGRYRKVAIGSRQEGRNMPDRSFADWP